MVDIGGTTFLNLKILFLQTFGLYIGSKGRHQTSALIIINKYTFFGQYIEGKSKQSQYPSLFIMFKLEVVTGQSIIKVCKGC